MRERIHPDTFKGDLLENAKREDADSKRSGTIHSSFQTASAAKQAQFEEKALLWCVMSYGALDDCEDPYFRGIVQVLDQKVKPISREMNHLPHEMNHLPHEMNHLPRRFPSSFL
jgi:hypothetical protein